MDKQYELRGNLTVYLHGPRAHMHLRDLQSIIAAYENAEDKMSSLTVAFYQDEIKPKTDTPKKEEKK